MNDEQFDLLLRDAAHSYRPPPEPDLDAMWENVSAELGAEASLSRAAGVGGGRSAAFRGRSGSRATWLRIAAALVVGVGLGRASTMLGARQSALHGPDTLAVSGIAAATPVARDSGMSRPYELETSQYLGQTAALLVALPSEARGGHTDGQFTDRAADLLTKTRLLLDSPAADEPEMRDLFEDLELMLAQVVRLQKNDNRLELELINRALEQRDVIPRLRTAAADISAN